MVNLVDDKHAAAPTFEGGANDLLAVTLFVVRSGIDEVQARIHRAVDGGNAAVKRDVAISEVADAEDGGFESRVTQFAARSEGTVPPCWACNRVFHHWLSVSDGGIIDDSGPD